MIEFDPAKDKVNIAKHGVSLSLAEEFDLKAPRPSSTTGAVMERHA